jgi:hypothetical protein
MTGVLDKVTGWVSSSQGKLRRARRMLEEPLLSCFSAPPVMAMWPRCLPSVRCMAAGMMFAQRWFRAAALRAR